MEARLAHNSAVHCEDEKLHCLVACFPSMGVLLLLLHSLRLGPPVLGTHAGGHAVPRVVKQATIHTLVEMRCVPLGGVVLGRMRTLAVAPPAETPLVSHAPPIILPGFRAHMFHSRVAQFFFIPHILVRKRRV